MGLDRNARSTSIKRHQAPDRLLADAEKNGGWTAIPNVFFKPNCLSASERLVFMALLTFTRATRLDAFGARSCVVSLPVLAIAAGVSRGTAKRVIATLTDKGLISRQRRNGAPSVTLIKWAQSEPPPGGVGSLCAQVGSLCALHGIRMIRGGAQIEAQLKKEEFKEELEEGPTEKELWKFTAEQIGLELGSEAALDFAETVNRFEIEGSTVAVLVSSPQQRDWYIDRHSDFATREIRSRFHMLRRFTIRVSG
jgi:hypothetical protein